MNTSTAFSQTEKFMATQKLKINSATENIFLVERFIEEVCEKFHITEEHYGNILIAITEAVNNAIQHGNKSNPNKSIEITLTAEKNKISFTIEDEGNGFDKVCFYDKGKKVELDFNVCAN